MIQEAPARWWHASGAQVVCELCPNECRIGTDGARGVCGLRFRKEGALWTRGWNGAAAVHLDPVEKKPLHHFLPGSRTLSLGLVGCNLGCLHCQNWSLSASRGGAPMPISLTPEAIADRALREEAASVSFTYNEPLISAEFWIETAKECRRRGLRTIAVTNGYANPGCAREFFGHMDAANVDLKGFSEDFYKSVCKGSLEPVLRTLREIVALGTCHLELATLLIPTKNDDDAELREMARWVVGHLGAETPLHVSAFHPDYRMLDVPGTSLEEVVRVRTLLREEGLAYVYSGNVADPGGSDTLCPGCGAQLLERSGFDVLVNRLVDGKCPDCGRPVPGVWT